MNEKYSDAELNVRKKKGKVLLNGINLMRAKKERKGK